MAIDRPILYVSIDPGCSEPNWKAPFEPFKAEIDRAVQLGWALAFAPDVVQRFAFGADQAEEKIAKDSARAVMRSADAFYFVGEEATKRQRDELEWFRMHARAPIFAKVPGSVFPRASYLEAPETFPWGEAAEKRSIEGWACKSCHRLYGPSEHDERIARWCCAKLIPCGECKTTWVDKFRSICTACSEKISIARHAKRERKPWAEGPVFSERDEKWFDDPGHAVDHATWKIHERTGLESEPNDLELGRELEDMRLLLSEPVFAQPVDVSDSIYENLADECKDNVEDLAARVDPHVKALNEALKTLGPLSYDYTSVAFDVKAWLGAAKP